jgi:hypothetical protein
MAEFEKLTRRFTESVGDLKSVMEHSDSKLFLT